ncbi:MAG: alpha-L-rhamnosidase N-terminal domain-containing protein [Candidatus Sumerlaeota bacterium]
MFSKTPNPFPPGDKSEYIWHPQEDRPWVHHVYFRREVTLDAPAKGAIIALYASTDYHLKVNGVTVGTGPVRGYAESPEYDTYDITNYLEEGDNVVAVEVRHIGYYTFQQPLKPAAFICWGDIETKNGTSIDLSSAENWKCCLSKAHHPYPPKFSFSLGPTMQFDARKAPTGWDKPGKPRGEWTEPVPAPGREKFGERKHREIPHLTQDARTPRCTLGAWSHAPLRTIGIRAYNEFDRNIQRAPKAILAACAWVHSREECTIEVLSRWTDFTVNGQRIEKAEVRVGAEKSEWKLNQGWNFLAAAGGTTLGTWELQFGFPGNPEIRFSADKSLDGPETCKLSAPLDIEGVDEILGKISAGNCEEIASDWETKELDSNGSSPILNCIWPELEEQIVEADNKNTPIELPAGKDASVIVDMGVVTLGRIFVEFEAAANTVIDVAYAEEMRGDRPAHFKMVLVNSGERHIAVDGPQRMETFCPRGSRFIQVVVKNASAPVRIQRVGMVEAMYPYDFPGKFRCSDPRLNDLWEWGRWTLQICSEDVVVDTPWRERGLYGGDMLAEWGTMLATSGDGRLIRRCCDIYFQTQNPETGWMPGRAPNPTNDVRLTDYALLVLLAAEWYCRYYNDTLFAERIYPAAERLIRGLLEKQDENGLFRSHWIFVAHAYKHHTIDGGYASTFNALAVRSLRAWASLQDMLGKNGAQARQKAALLAEKFNEVFWDDDKKAFVDIVKDEDQTEGCTLYANAWALLFAEPTDAQIPGALDRMEAELDQFDPETECVSPYGSFYALGALYRHKSARVAEKLIQTVYANMLHEPTGTIWEQALSDKTISHAWSTAPTFYATTQVAGIQMGWPFHEQSDLVRIAPQAENVDWAEAEALHPLGKVKVRWHVRGDKLFLDYEAPEDVKVEVCPTGRLAELQLVVNAL